MVVLLCAAILQPACIILPIPTPEKVVLEGRRVTEEQLVFLTPNYTTKEEVIKHLGNPIVIWEEAQVFSYDWVMRQGVLFWAVGGNYSAIGGIHDIPKAYSLIIQFDKYGRVKRYQKVVRSTMQSYGEFLREWVQESSTKTDSEPVDR